METHLQSYYNKLRTYLMSNPAQLRPESRDLHSQRNTRLVKRGDAVAVILHATDIITVHPDGTIILNSGGWKTPTTKDRINQNLPRHISLWQEQHVWYVTNSQTHDRVVFEDGMVIRPDGTFSTSGNVTEESITSQILDIKQYVNGYLDAFLAGELDRPSSGDCWYCYMVVEGTDKSWGETVKDTEHILTHFEQAYYVPSLLINAVKAYPVAPVVNSFIAHMWFMDESDKKIKDLDWYSDISRDQLKKSLTRYLKQQLGV